MQAVCGDLSLNSVVLSSRDHGQIFGLKSPIDAAQEAMRILAGKQVTTVVLKKRHG